MINNYFLQSLKNEKIFPPKISIFKVEYLPFIVVKMFDI